MIIHNTTYSISPECEADWIAWIQNVHLPKVKSLPDVKSCRFLKLLTEVETDGITYTIQTEIGSLASGEAFIGQHDPALQSDMMARFTGRMAYFQTLLKIM